MKKAIVALLTTILAAFGYVVVDKTTDARLADLEKQASSQNSVISFQQEEIESLRNKENYTSENINEYTELDSLIGKTIEYTGQKKFMFRLYHNGEIKYVPTGKTDLIDETKEPDTNKIPTSELSGDDWALAPGEEYNGYYIDDYFLYITSANRTIEEKTEIGKEKYYDDDYSVQTRPEKYEYRIHYVIKGKTDPALSGKRIKISEAFSILHFGPSETVIQEDGTFKVDGTISLPFNIESYYVFQYLSISIYQ